MKSIFSASALLLFLTMSNQLHAHLMHSSNTDGTPRLLVVYDDRYVKVEVLSDELLHFETAAGFAPEAHTPIYTTPMVARTHFLGPSKYYEMENGFETAKLRVTFEHQTRCIRTFDLARNFLIGTICPSNLDQSWKGLHFNAPIVKNLYGLGQFFTNAGTTEGDLIGRVWDPLPSTHGHSLVPFSNGASTRSLFPIIYALGPARESFAIFIDNIYKQMWTMNEQPWVGRWKAEMWGDQLRFFIIGGEDLPSVRRIYMDLTGRPVLPSKRVLGLWVSEFGFDNWDELRQKLYSLVAKNFPIEGFAMDLQWFGGRFYERGSDVSNSRMGTLEFDEGAFPDFRAQIAELSRDFGVELMLIEEPYISKFLNIHRQMGQNGFLAHESNIDKPAFLDANPWWGVGGMIDWTNNAAADFWHDDKRQKLIDLGIHFHWADLGEPEMYDPYAYYYGFPELGKNRHADIHNIYAFKWLESIERGYKRNQVSSRSYAMSRAGISGIQRFGGMWSGDLGANMGSLTAHLNAATHMSLSGMDYYSSDIGGFHGRSALNEHDAKELYTQWFANAALFDLPVRPHAWNIANNIETAPSLMGDVPSNLANLRLRYSLAPYYYSLMHNAHDRGEPIIPPLVYYFQEDQNVRSMGHERMIGPSLLAAAVAKHGERYRSVYLPRGRWYDYHANTHYDSAGNWTELLPTSPNGLFRLPLFARAGAIIPHMMVDDQTMNVLGQRRDSSVRSDLYLRIYADIVASEFVLFEDDGISNSEARSTIKISHIPQNNKATIIVDAAQGSSSNFPARRPLVIDYHAWRKDDCAKELEVFVNGERLQKCTLKRSNEAACWAPKTPDILHIDLGLREKSLRQEVVLNWSE